MAVYQFSCKDCSLPKSKVRSGFCDIEEAVNGWNRDTGDYMFYITCKMSEKPKKPKCPKCGGRKTIPNYYGQNNMSWVRGNGIVNDKAGARRDMDRHTLVNNDPYGYMRQPGEVDHMLDQSRRRGMNTEKILKKSAKLSREAAERARKREEYNLSEDQESLLIKISENQDGCEFSEFSEFDDLNKLVSSLMPDYICKLRNGKFALMAKGRLYIDNIRN